MVHCLQVYDKSNTSGLRLHSGDGFTATSRPKITPTASSGELLIRFVTDALHGGIGWKATFSVDCPPLQPGLAAIASFRDNTFSVRNRTISPHYHLPSGRELVDGLHSGLPGSLLRPSTANRQRVLYWQHQRHLQGSGDVSVLPWVRFRERITSGEDQERWEMGEETDLFGHPASRLPVQGERHLPR